MDDRSKDKVQKIVARIYVELDLREGIQKVLEIIHGKWSFS
jgi:hypothetical protein